MKFKVNIWCGGKIFNVCKMLKCKVKSRDDDCPTEPLSGSTIGYCKLHNNKIYCSTKEIKCKYY